MHWQNGQQRLCRLALHRFSISDVETLSECELQFGAGMLLINQQWFDLIGVRLIVLHDYRLRF